jgi:diaminopimelate decarboxylase
MISAAAPVDHSVRTPDSALLAEVVRRFGTPVYLYDLDRIRSQVARLRSALPPGVDVLYSVKANPLPELCRLLAGCGLGAEVASPGELRIALAAGFPPSQILVNGPYKHPDLLTVGGLTLSVDSVTELAQLADRRQPHRVVLRLRPDFDPAGVIPMGPGSRFGIPVNELAEARALLRSGALQAVGFHVYGGSQILRAGDAVSNLRRAFELSRRAAEVTGITPEVVGLGGGFGTPYGPHQPYELDLGPVGHELRRIRGNAGAARLMIELGRYLVAPAGWYLTRVVSEQHYSGRIAAVVDGGTHHRPDLCGLDVARRSFPPLVLGTGDGHTAGRRPTDVVGCLCLPWDVLAQDVALPPLRVGDVLAFANCGAYGVSAAPHSFIGHAPPAEVIFDSTASTAGIDPLRPAGDLT